MPEFVGFQTMGILVPYGITFDAVGVFGLAFYLLFRSWSTYCEVMTRVFTNLNLAFRDEKSGLVDSELVIEMWWKLTNIFISGWSNDQGSSARLLRNPIVIDLPVIRFAIFLPSIPAKFNVKIEILHCIYWYEQWGNVISRRRTLDRFKGLLQVVQIHILFFSHIKQISYV